MRPWLVKSRPRRVVSPGARRRSVHMEFKHELRAIRGKAYELWWARVAVRAGLFRSAGQNSRAQEAHQLHAQPFLSRQPETAFGPRPQKPPRFRRSAQSATQASRCRLAALRRIGEFDPPRRKEEVERPTPGENRLVPQPSGPPQDRSGQLQGQPIYLPKRTGFFFCARTCSRPCFPSSSDNCKALVLALPGEPCGEQRARPLCRFPGSETRTRHNAAHPVPRDTEPRLEATNQKPHLGAGNPAIHMRRVFFFGGYEHVKRDLPVPVTVAPATLGQLGLPANFANAIPFNQNVTFFIGKMDWQLTSNHRLLLGLNRPDTQSTSYSTFAGPPAPGLSCILEPERCSRLSSRSLRQIYPTC